MKNSPFFKDSLFCLILLVAIFSSCSKGSNIAIDEAFESYVNTFQQEAEKRGVEVSLDNLEAVFVNGIDNPVGVCGVGFNDYMGLGHNRIEIVEEGSCWSILTDLEREHLLFRVLAHAVLDRQHADKKLPNGYTIGSIMSSAFDSYSLYHKDGPLRDYYLDELFDPSTAFPEAFDNKPLKGVVFEDDFNADLDGWEVYSNNVQIFDTENYLELDPVTNSLVIKRPGLGDALISVVKRFDIGSFDECSNLVATADIKTEYISDGFFEFGLSLRKRVQDGSLDRIFISRNGQRNIYSQNGEFPNFQVSNYCLPSEAEVVTVSFNLFGPSSASMIVENVKVELFE